MLRQNLLAVKAVLTKELLVLFRYKTWPIQLFIFPFLMILHYIFIGKTFVGKEDLQAYTGFIVIGFTLYWWGNSVIWSLGMFLRMEKMRGTLEYHFLIPMPSVLLLASFSLANLVQNCLTISVMLVLVKFFFGMHFSLNIPLILLSFLLTWFALYGFGLAFAGLVMRFKDANSLALVFDAILMILSGVLYPLSTLPGVWQKIAYLSPVTISIQALRGVLISNWGWVVSMPYLLGMLAYGCVMLFLGWLFYYLMEKDARQKGALGHF